MTNNLVFSDQMTNFVFQKSDLVLVLITTYTIIDFLKQIHNGCQPREVTDSKKPTQLKIPFFFFFFFFFSSFLLKEI